MHKPDEDLKLKDICDNITNFAVAAGLYVLGENILKDGEALKLIISGYAFIGIALFIAIFSFLQALVLAQKGIYILWPMPVIKQLGNSILANLRLFLLSSVPFVLSFITWIAISWYLNKV